MEQYRRLNAMNDIEFEITDEFGNMQYIVNRNIPNGPHAERRIAQQLRVQGIEPSQVTRIYSEYSPCLNSCDPFLAKNFPDANVYYSYAYEIQSERWAFSQARNDVSLKE
ncbi:MAG: nucleic acid/nucleotide deaminase domain-containing protein [Aggregatilineales bacterium]